MRWVGWCWWWGGGGEQGLTQAGGGLLGQQVAGEHLLPGLLVVLRLELEHGLGLVLRQPHGLQVQVGQREGQVL